VLLVSPNGNYAEVLSKQGHKLTVLMGCGQEVTTTLAEFEKIGAQPVKAHRVTKASGEVIYFAFLPDGNSDLYMGGQRHAGRAMIEGRREWR
jgi:NAD/NADP transhydrogenase alpha subunit